MGAGWSAFFLKKAHFSGIIHEGILESGDIFPLVPNFGNRRGDRLTALLNQYVSEKRNSRSKGIVG